MVSSKRILLITAVLAGLVISIQSTSAISDDSNGIITIESHHDVSTTIKRLKSILTDKGMTIFKHVDHTAGAARVNIELRPTELLVFGNPRVGTPLMHCAQTMALDLPQKALAYEDADGKVWLAYNDPMFLAKRHGISGCEKPLQKVAGALKKFTSYAAGK